MGRPAAEGSDVQLLTARFLLPAPTRWLPGGGLFVRRGRIECVLSGPRAVARARTRYGIPVTDLGDVVVTAGLVNAHAHLELGELRGRLPGDQGFGGWVAAIVEERRRTGAVAWRRGLERGARRLAETGTTMVGDVDSTDAHDDAGALPLRVRRYREVLDARDPGRAAAALHRVRRRLPPTRARVEGISPHAPFSVSDELLRRAADLAARRRIPVQVHWSESPEEVEWLTEGGGPFAAFLPPSPRRRGLDLLGAAGLLGPATSLVHGNHPDRGEPGRIAAAGMVVVHCPGTHAFFRRAPFPWRRYRRAGVCLALGTDSLASNADLDLRREMRLARVAAPFLEPVAVWRMGTTTAARALGVQGRLGELSEGFDADLAAFTELGATGRRAVLDGLTMGVGHVSSVWVAGRRVFPEDGAADQS